MPKEHFGIKAIECKIWGLKKWKKKNRESCKMISWTQIVANLFFLSEKGSVLISPWNKMVLGEKKNTCINAQQLDAGSYIDYWEITLNLSGEHTARPRKYILYYHFTFSMTQNHKYQSQMYEWFTSINHICKVVVKVYFISPINYFLRRHIFRSDYFEYLRNLKNMKKKKTIRINMRND